MLRGTALLRGTFNPDGSRIVTASAGGTAAVWDADSGDQLAVSRGTTMPSTRRPSAPTAAASSPRAPTGQEPWWDADSGDRLAVAPWHNDAVNAAAFSPDGGRIVTARLMGQQPCGTQTAETDWPCSRGHGDAVNAAAFSADGSRIVTASIDTTARLWDGKSFARVATLEQGDAVSGAAFSSNGELVVTVGATATQSVSGTARTASESRCSCTAMPLPARSSAPVGGSWQRQAAMDSPAYGMP